MATIITGKNSVLEAIKAGRKVEELYVQLGTNEEILTLAKAQGLNVKELSKTDLNKLLPPNNQGIGAKVEDYRYITLENALAKPKAPKLFLMLDSLEDPHNLGAIMRSADAFNVDAIILRKDRSVGINATVAKVSTGSIEYVDVVQVTNLHQTIRTLKEHGFWVVGSDADTPQNMHEIDASANLCLVVGGEGKGMTRLVRDNCDYIVKIPMSGHVNSLNASVSTAIILYEIYRKRGA